MRIKCILALVLVFLMIAGCSSRRIDLIEETFGINLPDNYKVLKNTTRSGGFAGADFEVNVELEFKLEDFEILKKELMKIDSLKDVQQNKFYKNMGHEEGTLVIDDKSQTLKFYFIHF